MVSISIESEIKRHPRLFYVISILNKHPYSIEAGVQFNLNGGGDLIMSYGGNLGEHGFFVPRADFIFGDVGHDLKMNKYEAEEEYVYSIEKDPRQGSRFYDNGIFGFDIFETIFFHLSRYEERSIKFSDYLTDRYAFERELLVVKNGLEKVPVVDELIAVFIEKLTNKKVEKGGEIYLSHDIDYISKFKSPLSIIRKLAGHLRHRKSVKGFGFLWQSYLDYLLRGRDGFDTFEWMLSKKNIDKTIYFLVGGRHREDNQYDLKGAVFQKALKLSKERGYKIGIHPSYESWDRKELIKREKKKLENEVGEEIVVSRQHFLNFDIEKTPILLESLGIREDSSLGYTRHVGYRCGTGFPFIIYDFQNEKAFDVVERPMVFMDVAWLFEAIRNDNFAIPEFEDYYGGFLFHNSTFDEMGARGVGMKDHYLKYFT